MSDWKQDLRQSIAQHEVEIQNLEQKTNQQNTNIKEFFQTKVLPAFEDLKTVLEEQKREVTINYGLDEVTIKVLFNGKEEMNYGVQAKLYGTRVVVHPVERFSEGGKRFRGEGYFRSGAQDYSIDDLSKEEIIQHFSSEYGRSLKRSAQNK